MNHLLTAIEFNGEGIRLLSGYALKSDGRSRISVVAAKKSPLLLPEADGHLERKAASTALRNLIKETESQLGKKLSNFIILLPPDGYSYKEAENGNSTVGERVVQHDYQNIASMIYKEAKSPEAATVYCRPLSFVIDNNQKREEFPLGVKSEYLGVKAEVHRIDRDTFDHYRKIVSDASITPYFYLVSPFALDSYLLSFDPPKTFLTLDVEEEYTSLAYYDDPHLSFAENLPFGLHDGITKAAEILGVSEEVASDYARLFGFRKEAGFPYYTDEKKTLAEISAAFQEAFTPLTQQLKNEIAKTGAKEDVNLIFVGEASRMEGLDAFLGSGLGRKVLLFTEYPIGAREKGYLSLLGALQIASYPYQKPIEENQRSESQGVFQHSVFSRG